MKVAVTYENGEVFQHFGHSEAFKLYEVEGGEVKSSEVVPTNGSGHGALAGFLRERGVEVLICGGIGAGAQNALAEAGIKLYGGVSGSADSAVQALIEGNLSYNPDVMCDHHGEDHHGDHENCGGHGEGNKTNKRSTLKIKSVNTEKSERVMIYKIGCSFYVLKELILKFKERKRG